MVKENRQSSMHWQAQITIFLIQSGCSCWNNRNSALHSQQRKHLSTELLQQVLSKEIGNFDSSLIQVDPSTENISLVKDREDHNKPTGDSIPAENIYGPEPLLNACVTLLHNDQYEIAKVIASKRNADGNYNRCKHKNPRLDSQVFVVKFSDGEHWDEAYI